MSALCKDQTGLEIPIHRPAMVPQVLNQLSPSPGDRALDLTAGTGGHSIALAEAIGADGLLVGIDADADALAQARTRLTRRAPCPFKLIHGPFSRAGELTAAQGIEGFDVALADLGVGTHQLLQPERGLSFDSRCRLDMRYDPDSGPSAWEVVNQMPQREMADLFHGLGQERHSRPIAAAICRTREQNTIDTPAELSELIKVVVARRSRRGRTWRIHPATRVMMALRIHVNREMEELDALLEALPGLLNPGGRACIITYHSLEARRVKHAWRGQVAGGLLELLTPKPLKPTDEQVADNPKVRSAQLRAARRTAGGTA